MKKLFILISCTLISFSSIAQDNNPDLGGGTGIVLRGDGSGADIGGTHGQTLRDQVDRYYDFQRDVISVEEFRSDSSRVYLDQMIDEINRDTINVESRQNVDWMNPQSQNDVDINVQDLRREGIREITLDDGRVFSVEELQERLRNKVRQQIRRN